MFFQHSAGGEFHFNGRGEKHAFARGEVGCYLFVMFESFECAESGDGNPVSLAALVGQQGAELIKQSGCRGVVARHALSQRGNECFLVHVIYGEWCGCKDTYKWVQCQIYLGFRRSHLRTQPSQPHEH